MVVFTARTDMVAEHWRSLKPKERLCRGKESQADRPSLIPCAIYYSRGGTLLPCYWLMGVKDGSVRDITEDECITLHN